MSKSKKNNVLFIVENDFFPRDIRVYNEVSFLSKRKKYNCFVIAPKGNKEKLFEKIDDKIKCFRFPHFNSTSKIGFLFEYSNAAFWIFILTPFLTIRYWIRIIHVANPPDFIIPLIGFLKLTGIKFIFDQHDLSVETLKGKLNVNKKNILAKLLFSILLLFEKLSIYLSSTIISTNQSIKKYTQQITKNKKIFIVRNSNPIKYQSIEDIPKNPNNTLHLGYFGIIGNDYASGYNNLITIGTLLKKRNIQFKFIIIGDGSGLKILKNEIANYQLTNFYQFLGFLPLNNAFDQIIQFDFGVLPWPNIPKNNLHTAMKIMDYMCCGVPVCSLKLKEQIYSSGGIGIHTETFEKMVKEIISIYSNKKKYETLRKKSLLHFNTTLAWEIQEKTLLKAYEFIS